MSQESTNRLNQLHDDLSNSINQTLEKSHRNLPIPPVSKKIPRTQGIKFFLTYPQCDCSAQLALTRVLFKYPDLKFVVACQETHNCCLL